MKKLFLIAVFLIAGCTHKPLVTSSRDGRLSRLPSNDSEKIVNCGSSCVSNFVPPKCHPSPATQAVLNRIYKNGIVIPKMFAADLPKERAEAERAAQSSIEIIPLAEVRDSTIESGRTQIPIRVYRPKFNGSLPVVLFLHGGGWCQGSINTYDSITRELSRSLPAIVVSVGYRLAPEAPFPAALDDSFAALNWVITNIHQLGGNIRKLAIAGDSAGGSLTAILARKAAVNGLDVAVQVLIYPSTDLSNMDYPSYQKYGQGGYFLTEYGLRTFRRYYLPMSKDWRSPDASPILAPDTELKAVAPAYFVIAGCDPLQDEGFAYAKKLNELGVPVRIQWESGMVHGFLGSYNNPANALVAAEVKPIFQRTIEQLRSMLANAP